MKKLKRRLGMTMAELLIVVAIIIILGSLGFIAVWNYQRSLGQLERDGIAKEIFVAAQNHLTAAYGEGYLGITDFGTKGTSEEDNGKEVYYYAVNGTISDSSALGQMLPFGSIDETVRTGGNYIVRYQKDTGLVLDVFYCSRNGSPSKFNYSLSNSDYSDAMSVKGLTDAQKKSRREWTDGSILGWYGGTDAALLPNAKLQSPTIKVVNAEKLYVEITNPNTNVEDSEGNSVTVSLRLLIKGLSSGTEHYLNVNTTENTVILDDITSENGHFGYRRFDDMGAGDSNNGFIPGENISVQAVAFSTGTLTNIANSNKVITNSLFEKIDDLPPATNTGDATDGVFETACIGNIRHLENLDCLISNLGEKAAVAHSDLEAFKITNAIQTADFSWNTFKEKTGGDSTSVTYSSTKTIYLPAIKTESGCYSPVVIDYPLTYDGQNHSISDVKVNVTGELDAGLFGSSTTITGISNLELIDFSITGNKNAGALAGTLTTTVENLTISNVLARNSTNKTDTNISGADTGGLIGNVNGFTVQYCAAAVIVNGTQNVGGLIGSTSSPIIGCYSGGHVEDIKDADNNIVGVRYSTEHFDVTGNGNGCVAGGLVGRSTAAISNCYSTCSVSGPTAGGFAGNASGSISNCYATGLVDEKSVTKYAFLASGTAALTGNYYYQTINEVEKTDESTGKTSKEPMSPIAVTGEYKFEDHLAQIRPVDINTESYNSFMGAFDLWDPARPYNVSLAKYFGGKYPLRTVLQLPASGAKTKSSDNATYKEYFVATHYGDWPSPEVFFINTN